ncbi:alr0857 family protein [Fortiea contorta]|uniref:alr0857 family protein n=1 Tax=Fortiea contorta TaxID=1892405 RepID=UPI0003475232|nr:alr0857 family protein [Fortiea contorta]
MLKLTYTERSFYLECLTLSLEEWVAQRAILALRVGQSFHIEPSTASFLLPADLPGIERLKAEVLLDDGGIIALSSGDADYTEVILRGSWLSDGLEEAVGVFVTAISDLTEFYVHKLWQEAQTCASVMSE